MILYRPTDGDVHSAPIHWRPRTCFTMAQLGAPIPPIVQEIRENLSSILTESGFDLIDADGVTTGKDFLLKIWRLALGVPVGIAILHKEIPSETLANIFYELGWLQAYGKETLIIKTKGAAIPSDFVRTEYVEFGKHFDRKMRAFMTDIQERADYFITISEQVERNPLLAIDYLKRAYLLTGDDELRTRAREIHSSEDFGDRAKNSVEMLMINF